MEKVEIQLIAAGYDWICPICNTDNRVACLQETVTCSTCMQVFDTNDNPDHATR